MTIPMALVDFIPVALFLAAMCLLQYDLYLKFPKWAFALFAGGGIMVFTAGFYKAVWKLLYAAGICDFEKLNQMFFPLQSTGFLLVGFATVALLVIRQGAKNTSVASVAAAPAVFSGTIIFVAVMVFGVGALCISLAVIAGRMKKLPAAVLFVAAFIFMLGMGYLSSKDFSSAVMNWVAQGVNIIGQEALLLGTWMLHKAGLREFRLHEK
ncbi:MAG: hypothetical protein LUE29_00655 [Lachnospiraceae bacterium]|nr:hypothetical protein [Lachnospiraceae bacterium]